MTFRVRGEANADLIAVLAWNIQQRRYAAAAGINAAWEAGQNAIESMPRLHALAPDAPPGRECRHYLTRRYGYRIVFEVTATEVVVLAFVHTRRRPGSWHSRLTP